MTGYVTEQMEMWHRLYLFLMSGSFFCLCIAVIIFIRLDIWSVIGFFTGRQKKSRRRKNGRYLSSFQLEWEVMLVHTDERI